MEDYRKNLETTKLEEQHAADTVHDVSPSDTTSQELDTPNFGMGRHQLIENYRAIVNHRAIYYPVPYRLIRELGRGRQGIVFLGLRQGARGCITRHAIKLFDPSIYSSAQKYWTDMGRISSQTMRLQATNSPNLVSRDIYEETNGIGYTQMEVIDGVDLRYIMSGEHLDTVRARSSDSEWATFTDAIFRFDAGTLTIQPGVAIYIMRMLLRGLEILHEKGFVHSDIKPANIMIDRLGYIKLIDFGRAVVAKEKMTLLLGSPLFMAPETHRREPSLIQSDIYGVGLMGLEMLRGKPLISGNITEKDILDFKMTLPDRLPELLPEHVLQNAEFVSMLRRFIDPDPEKRFSNAVSAESDGEGLRLVHKQLTQLNKDTDYGRELGYYMNKLMESKRDQTEKEIFFD